MKYLILFTLFILSSCSSGVIQKKAALNQGKVKLCFIGDTGQNSPTQRQVAKALLKENCHAIYILGDIIYPSGLSSDKDPQFKTKFLDYYEKIAQSGHRPKIHILLGNHDYRGDPDVWKDLSKSYPFIVAPARYYFQAFGDICIASLDTDPHKYFFQFIRAMSQNSWLDDVHEKLQSCDLKIALAHHPYLSSGKDHGNATGRIKNFLEENVIGKFDYFIAGHEHIMSYEGEVKGTKLFISGAAGTPDKGYLPGYLTIETDHDTLVTIKRITSDNKIKEEKFLKLRPTSAGASSGP